MKPACFQYVDNFPLLYGNDLPVSFIRLNANLRRVSSLDEIQYPSIFPICLGEKLFGNFYI
jgi:hypothetical protein